MLNFTTNIVVTETTRAECEGTYYTPYIIKNSYKVDKEGGMTDACDPTTDHSKFIFFGCWNKIDCKKEYVYRDIVLDYIRDNETDINQLYIAGDNWYQNDRTINGESFKVYLTDILTTGYAKLYAMNKEVYIAVGNHDEDKDYEYDQEKHKFKKDCNLNTQKYYLQQIKANGLSGNTQVPTLELLQEFAAKNKFLDNSMCERGIYIYADHIGVCYNKGNVVIIINTNRFEDDDKIVNNYIRKIRKVISGVTKRINENNDKTQIFVMGHIPLFGFKMNKIEPHKVKAIMKLFNLFATKNIIYICADTHNFNIMKIDHKGKVVIQITAGTGGASPDVLDTEYINRFYSTTYVNVDESKSPSQFQIDAFALNPYGYVSISSDNHNGDIIVCYTQVIKAEPDKPKQFTYRVSVAKKTITYNGERETPIIDNKEMNMSMRTKVCSVEDSIGYITNANASVACYKKKYKNKTLPSNI
jgi:hypothetical protein